MAAGYITHAIQCSIHLLLTFDLRLYPASQFTTQFGSFLHRNPDLVTFLPGWDLDNVVSQGGSFPHAVPDVVDRAVSLDVWVRRNSIDVHIFAHVHLSVQKEKEGQFCRLMPVRSSMLVFL